MAARYAAVQALYEQPSALAATRSAGTDERGNAMQEDSREPENTAAHAAADRIERRLSEEAATITDRFERRITEEVSGVRVEMHRGFGELRAEMHKGFGELRAEIAGVRSDLRTEIAAGRTDAIRWAFLFWVGQLGAITGLLAYMK